MTKKEELKQAVDYLSEGKCALLLKLLNSNGHFRDIMSAVWDEKELNKVDTAIPTNVSEELRQLNPNFGHWFVYSYNDVNHGRVENVAELILERLIND